MIRMKVELNCELCPRKCEGVADITMGGVTNPASHEHGWLFDRPYTYCPDCAGKPEAAKAAERAARVKRVRDEMGVKP
jgi:hypothetical protein